MNLHHADFQRRPRPDRDYQFSRVLYEAPSFTARGIWTGCLVSTVLWAIIGYWIWAIFR